MHNPAMNDQPNPAAPETALTELCDAIRPGKSSQRIHGCIKQVGHTGLHCNGQNVLWPTPRLAAVPVPPPAAMDDGTALDATAKRCIVERDVWRGPVESLEDYATRLRQMLVGERIAAAEGKRTVTFEEWWSREDVCGNQKPEDSPYVQAFRHVALAAWNAARETKEDEG